MGDSNMNNYILFNKLPGETTSEVIARLKQLNPEVKNAKIGHLGTLDPMASGLMVFLVGDRTKEFLNLQKLHKVYTFTIVFDVETDSYDVLGIPKIWENLGFMGKLSESQIHKIIKSFEGKISQCPPPYSAIRIKGKPLYWWQRQNKPIKIKPRTREIFSIEVGKIYKFKIDQLKKDLKIIKNIKGDFRQTEIIGAWTKLFKTIKIKTLPALDLKIECSSGTYIRSLAHDIGKKFNVPTVCLDIKRILIGNFKI
jgi:tRNA pseudouridine55 synthase